MAGVIDSLMVTLGLDPSKFKKGVTEVNNNLQQMNNAVKQTGGEVAQLGNKWGGTLSGLVKGFAGPLLAGASLGAMVRSFTGDVSKVAQMTWAYNGAMDEERKRRAMLQRVTREDLILYKHSREAMTKFEIATADLSATFMRSFHPAMKFSVDMLNKLSDWISKNQNNIVRFLLVVGTIVSVTLVPAFRKWAAAILANPLTWVIAALGALAVIIDDLVVYMQGGKTAFGGFWAQFGTGAELSKKFRAVWQQVLDGFEKFKAYIPTIIRGVAILAGLKIASVGIMAVTNSLKALGTVLGKNIFVIALMAIIFAISDLITYIKGGESALSDLWGVFGTGQEIGDAFAKTWKWLKEVFTENKTAILAVAGSMAAMVVTFKTVTAATAVVKTSMAAFAGSFKALGVGITILKGLAAGIKAVTLAIASNPIGAAIVAIIAVLTLLIMNWDKVREVAGNVADYIKTKWEEFKNWFAGLGDSFPEVWENLKASFAEWVDSVKTKISNAFNDAANSVKAIWGEVVAWFEDKFSWIMGMAEKAKNIASGIGDKVSEGFEAAKNFLGFGDDKEEQQPSQTPIPTSEQLTQSQIPAAAQVNNTTETKVTSTTHINGMVINTQATDAAGLARDLPNEMRKGMPGFYPATNGVFQ